MIRRRHSVHAIAVAACATLSARASHAQETLSLIAHAEFGGGAVLTPSQQRQLGMLGAFEGTLRVGVRFHPSVSARLSGSYWGYPATTQSNASVMYGASSLQAGVRIDPAIWRIGRLWLDLDVGVGFTGARPLQARPAGGAGVGFDFRILSFLSVAPFARVEVILPLQGNDQLASPITLVGGVSVTYELPLRRQPAQPPQAGAPRAPREIPVAVVDPDPDHDGVSGDADRCPEQPETVNHYEDTDGCPDDPDADHDGVALPADRCPEQPETRNNLEDDDGCPDTLPPVQLLGGTRITVNGTILFENNRDRILAESFPLLDQIVATLQGHPEIVRVRVEGHTDDQGDARRNRRLSSNRAQAVERYLRTHGVDRRRLRSEGFGADRPVATGTTPEDRARNRRVEFTIIDPPQGITAPGPTAPTPPTPPTEDDHHGDDHHHGDHHGGHDGHDDHHSNHDNNHSDHDHHHSDHDHHDHGGHHRSH